jgi:type VI secretion system secreted protein VgrG
MARQIELTTPLGPDVLLFRAMRGREELGRLSEFDLSAVSTRIDISPGDLLGQNVTVKIELLGGGYRHWNGYVTRFAQGGMIGRYHEYRLTVRPWLWFLTRTTDCRIFQEKTVPDILKEVFGDHPVAVFEDDLTGTYASREYCVQYRETDFDFVSRLMEEEGIYYYLEHEDGRHVMKLVDSYSGHQALDNVATIPYYPPHEQVPSTDGHISAWTFVQNIQPGAVALDDYDFTKPKADLLVKAKLVQQHERADYEVFDYPGEYWEMDDGDHYVRARLDELHAGFDRAEAECNVREIAVGRLFSLTNAPRADQEREYLITGAWYELRDNAYEAAAVAGDETTYHCQLTALQSRQQFRPDRLTPRPTVKGPQSALVVGPAGEEIWCDKYGRVKVQFYWDRYGKKDENSSCWIRVSHPWAGGTWGMVALPRIGQEVLVDFLEGDPDRPIITGRVYNADQMPPYALPANKTQTGTKTRSSKGGGAANFNEIRFEDLKGSEQLFIHAEKNQDIEVENDETHWVGHDRTKTIDHDETVEVKHDRIEKVGNDETIEIGRDRSMKIDRDKTETVLRNKSVLVQGRHAETIAQTMEINVGATLSETVAINYSETVGAAMELTVGGALAISVGGVMTEAVGGTKAQTVGGSFNESTGGGKTVSVGGALSETVDKAMTVKVGENLTETVTGKHEETVAKEYLLQAKKIQLKAEDELSIKVGSAEIVVKKNGDISVKGAKINIKGSGDVTLKGSKIAEN